MGTIISTVIQDGLSSILFSKAKQSLKKLYNKDTESNATLEEVLKEIAMQRFKDIYKYDYNEHWDQIKPTTSLGTNKPAKDFVNVKGTIVVDQVADYLSKGALNTIGLPTWMSDLAKGDLSGIVGTFVSQDTTLEWKIREYTRIYDGKIEDQESYRCDAVMVYCNGVHTGLGQTANNCVMYFIGVYYTVPSASRNARNELESAAYETAVRDLGKAGAKVPTNHKELTDLLDLHAEKRFAKEFEYNYIDNPPLSLRASGTDAAMLGRNSHTYYIPDLGAKLFEPVEHKEDNSPPAEEPPQDAEPKHEGGQKVNAEPNAAGEGQASSKMKPEKQSELRRHIYMQIFKGINLEIDSLRNQAIDDVVGVYTSILSNAATNSWDVHRIDQTYTPADPSQNSIRQSGVVMSWFGHKTTHTDEKITVHYIYFKTIVYEQLEAKQQLAKEMLKQLCVNLQVHLKETTLEKGRTFTDTVLRDYLSKYAKNRWEEIYKFKFEGQNTKPLDLKQPLPGRTARIVPYEKLFYLPTYPTTLNDVQNLMNRELFVRQIPLDAIDPLFPKHVRTPLYDDIRDHIFAYGSPDTPKHMNVWHEADHICPIVDSSNDHKDVEHYSFYMYALADMALSKKVSIEKGKELQQGVHMQFFYVYYLGIVSPFEPSSW